jgi:hypothetical protein
MNARAHEPAKTTQDRVATRAHEGDEGDLGVLVQAMGERLGADVSDVRFHDDANAAEAAHDLDARAFTVGQDIHFGAGELDPGSPDGQRLIAHELVHAVQDEEQADDDEEVVATKSRTSEPGDAAEAEADRLADALVDGTGPVSVRATRTAHTAHRKKKGKGKGGKGKAGVAVPPEASSLKQRLLQLLYETREVRDEMGLKGVDPDQGLARGQELFQRLVRAFIDMFPEAKALDDAGRAALEPVAAGISRDVAEIAQAHEPLAGVAGVVHVDIATAFPNAKVTWSKADLGFGGEAVMIHQADKQGAAAVQLEAATAELESATAEHRKLEDKNGGNRLSDLDGDVAMTRLTALGGLLASLQPDDQDKLKAKIGAMRKAAHQLLRYVEPSGDRAKELAARVSDACRLVDLPPLTGDTIADVLGDQAKEGGFDSGQLDSLSDVADEIKDGLQYIHARRYSAVIDVQAEAGQKDPDPDKSFMEELAMELAFAALSAATAGIGGIVAGEVAGKVAESATKEATKKVLEKGAEYVAEAVKTTIEKAVDVGKDRMKVEGGGELPESDSGESIYLNVAYFGEQRAKLDAAQTADFKDVRHTIKAAAHSHDDPETALSALDALKSNLELAGEKAYDLQAEHTRAKYADALARAELGETAAGDTDVSKAEEIEHPDMDPFHMQFARDVQGMLNFEAVADVDDPVMPVRLTSAWAMGLNKGLCEKLEEIDPLIEAGIPMRARIRLSGMYWMVVARGETAGSVTYTAEGFLREWLAKKSPNGDADEGARVIIEEEIGGKAIKDQGVHLESAK